MTEAAPEEPLAWRHRVSRMPRDGVDERCKATDPERVALAAHLGIPAVAALEVRYRIRPIGKGRYTLKGRFEATITQVCGVTLEPFEDEVVDDFSVELWPEDQIGAPNAPADHFDGSEPDDPEPIRDGVIDVGPVVREHLAMAIDPYPRKPGAELAWKDEEPAATPAEEKVNPFAVLRRLKEPPGS